MNAIIDPQAREKRLVEIHAQHLAEVGPEGWLKYSEAINKLLPRFFSSAEKIPKPIPRFLINGKAVCTAGNLTTIISQAKGGKSAFTGAMIAAAICADRGAERDTLGITATAPGGKVLLHVDTELSRHDHQEHILRQLRRAGVDQEPIWLHAPSLTDLSPTERHRALPVLMQYAHREAGLFATILDGGADLVNDVNDTEESNGFVAELHALAIRYDCPIISVVHENPGGDSGKMRGHFGSQLERKAESNLRLRKVDEITVVFGEKNRGAPILERDGPRFIWSDEAGMHVSVASKGSEKDAEEIEEMRGLARRVFSEGTLRYSDACDRIEAIRHMKDGGGGKWFTRMKKARVIQDDLLGKWRVIEP
jgi:hypothetical protein